jgi:integrase
VPHHGSWALRFNVKGWRKLLSLRTTNESTAVEAYEKAKAELVLGTPPAELSVFKRQRDRHAAYTVAKAWADFKADSEVGGKRRATTMEDYISIFGRWIAPPLGNSPLAVITPDDVLRTVRRAQGAGLSYRSSVNVLKVLRLIYAFATRRRRFAGANPCDGLGRELQHRAARSVRPDEVDRLGDDDPRPPKPFLPDERRTLLAYLTSPDCSVAERALLLLGLRAGLRIGEALGLRMSDVDLDTRVVRVQRTFTRHGRLHQPKTKAGARTVDLRYADVLAGLRAHLIDRRAANLQRGLGRQDDWLFVGLMGRAARSDHPPLACHVYRHVVVPLFGRLGLAHHVFHDLRHTFATMLYAQTRDLVYVAQQLGHASTSVTYRVYVHWIGEVDREYAARAKSELVDEATSETT